MTIYYLVLSIPVAVLLIFGIYERNRHYINLPFGVNKVLPISIGLGLILVESGSYWSIAAGFVPILWLSFFASYRVELKKYTSTADLLGSVYGKGIKIFFGVASFIFTIALLYQQLAMLIEMLKKYNLTAICLFAVVAIYLSIILAVGSLTLLAWHQVGLLLCFILFCMITTEANEEIGSSVNIFTKFKFLTQGNHNRGFLSTILLITPLQSQILWLFQEKKYARRTYKIGLGILLYLIFIALFNHGIFTKFISYSSQLTPAVKDAIRKINGFSIAWVSYRLFLVIPLVCLSSSFLREDIIAPVIGKRSTPQIEVALKAACTILIILAFPLLRLLLRSQISCSPILLDLLLLSFQLPLLLIVFYIRSNAKELFLSLILSYITYGLTFFLSRKWAEVSLFIALGVSFVSFLVIHYYINGRIVFNTISHKEKKILQPHYITWKKIQTFLLAPVRFVISLRDNVDYYGAPYNKTSAFLACFFLAVPSVFQPKVLSINFLTSVTVVNSIGFCLAFFLFLYPCWPSFLAHLFSFYWHFTLVYSLSFFPVFSYFMLGGSNYWVINIALSTLLLARFLRGRGFITFHILGSSIGILLCYYLLPISTFSDMASTHQESMLLFGYTYLSSLVIGHLLFSDRYYSLQYTTTALNHLSQEFLHLNTNVVGMAKSPTTILDMILTSKLQSIKKDDKGDILFKMDQKSYELLQSSVHDIRSYIDIGTEIIRRRSRYFAPIRQKEFDQHSAVNCVESAIEIFSRIDTSYHSAPKIIVEKDFIFYGSNEHLEQAILNLIACTFAHCGKDVSKKIIIKNNRIIYQYYGKPIATKELPYLFTYLAYSQRSTGYYKEVGALAYVKRVMSSFGGDIICYCHPAQNTEKSYTRFTLYFPSY
ncbi:MAG: hypothetical protein AAF770_02770 [Bacteroidota bacterium]